MAWERRETAAGKLFKRVSALVVAAATVGAMASPAFATPPAETTDGSGLQSIHGDTVQTLSTLGFEGEIPAGFDRSDVEKATYSEAYLQAMKERQQAEREAKEQAERDAAAAEQAAQSTPTSNASATSTNTTQQSSGNSNSAPRSTPTPPATGNLQQQLVAAARGQIGGYMDCTDLVQNALAAVGKTTRRDQGGYDLGTMDFGRFGTSIAPGQIQYGDIMMRGGHVAIYTGNGSSHSAVHGGWGGMNVAESPYDASPYGYASIIRVG